MTEQLPTQQPSHLPVATAPNKHKKWPWVVGAIVLIPALATVFGAAAAEGNAAPTVSPTSQAAVAVASPAAVLATRAWNSAPEATGLALLTTPLPPPRSHSPRPSSSPAPASATPPSSPSSISNSRASPAAV